nr:hypothetical protein [Tanacetum cinerariifolium]
MGLGYNSQVFIHAMFDCDDYLSSRSDESLAPSPIYDRPVSTDVPKLKVTRTRHAKPIVTKTNSPTRRHINHSPSPKASNSPLRVTTVQALVVNAAQGVIDSGCLKHMTGNMSYLSDFEELNGGYVAFG